MIKKFFKFFKIVFLFTLIFTLHVEAVPKELTVGVAAEFPPFVFVNKGEIVGFDVDLINIIANSLGYKVEIQDMAFQDLFFALKNKEIDVAVSGISATVERKRNMDFSNSYYFPKLAVLTKSQSNIRSIKDLRDSTIGAVSGTTAENFLANKLSIDRQMKIISFGYMSFMVEALKAGKIDAALDEDAKIRMEQSLNPSFSYFILNQPEYANKNSYAIAFRKNSKLTNKFDDILLELKVSGQLDSLKKKWGFGT